MDKDKKKTFNQETLEEEQGFERNKIGFAEALKKLVTVSMGAAFLTEESIRSYVHDLKLPKDVLNLVLSSAAKSKEEITQRISRELIKTINRINLIEELYKFAQTHRFKIKAEIEIEPKDKSKNTDTK